MADTAHKTKATSWVTVLLITLASIAYAFALPMENMALAIVGTVLLVVGVVLGFAGKIMEDVH